MSDNINQNLISIVIPCYNSEKSNSELVERIKKVKQTIDCRFQVILVNDCSMDNTSSELITK